MGDSHIRALDRWHLAAFRQCIQMIMRLLASTSMWPLHRVLLCLSSFLMEHQPNVPPWLVGCHVGMDLCSSVCCNFFFDWRCVTSTYSLTGQGRVSLWRGAFGGMGLPWLLGGTCRASSLCVLMLLSVVGGLWVS